MVGPINTSAAGKKMVCITAAMKKMSFRKYPGVLTEGLQQLDRAGSIACHSQWAFLVLLLRSWVF